MLNLPQYYQAEIDYRREALRRDWRPLRSRRTTRAAVRNQVQAPAQDPAPSC